MYATMHGTVFYAKKMSRDLIEKFKEPKNWQHMIDASQSFSRYRILLVAHVNRCQQCVLLFWLFIGGKCWQRQVWEQICMADERNLKQFGKNKLMQECSRKESWLKCISP